MLTLRSATQISIEMWKKLYYNSQQSDNTKDEEWEIVYLSSTWIPSP